MSLHLCCAPHTVTLQGSRTRMWESREIGHEIGVVLMTCEDLAKLRRQGTS